MNLSVKSEINPSEAPNSLIFSIISDIYLIVISFAYTKIIFWSISEISFLHFFTACGAKVDLQS